MNKNEKEICDITKLVYDQFAKHLGDKLFKGSVQINNVNLTITPDQNEPNVFNIDGYPISIFFEILFEDDGTTIRMNFIIFEVDDNDKVIWQSNLIVKESYKKDVRQIASNYNQNDPNQIKAALREMIQNRQSISTFPSFTGDYQDAEDFFAFLKLQLI